MKLLIICGCVALALAGVDRNKKTNAGEQSSTLEKTGNGGKIVAKQMGGRGSGNFNGGTDADGKGVKSSQGNAGVKGKDASADKYKATSDGKCSYKTTGGSCDADYQIANCNPPYEVDLSGCSKTAKAKLKKASDDYVMDIAGLPNNGEYTVETAGNQKDAIIKNKAGTTVAKVSNLKNKEHIKVAYGVSKYSVGSKAAGGGMTDNYFIPLENPNSFLAKGLTKQATLNEQGTKTQIKDGLFSSATTDLKEGSNSVDLTGRLAIVSLNAKAEYETAEEKDCPYNLYSARRSNDQRNKKWKFTEPEFKIFWDDLQVSADYDESGNKLDVKFPVCFTYAVPVTFPPGTDLKKLALGLSVYFPGCPGLVCRGRTCGNEVTMLGGVGGSETCFTSDICKLQPAANSKDLFAIGGNSETDSCSQPYNGGKLVIKTTVCQNTAAKPTGQVCPLLAFSKDQGVGKKNIVGIGRLYVLRDGKSQQKLGSSCNIKAYYLEGCRDMGVDYKVSGFGFDGDSSKNTGIQGGAKVYKETDDGDTGSSGGGGGGGGPSPATTAKPSGFNFWNRGGGNTGGATKTCEWWNPTCNRG